MLICRLALSLLLLASTHTFGQWPLYPTETTGSRPVAATGTVDSGTAGTVLNDADSVVPCPSGVCMPGTDGDFTTMFIDPPGNAIIDNLTAGSSCAVTVVAATSLTCDGLVGGTRQTFDPGDSYRVRAAPNIHPNDWNAARAAFLSNIPTDLNCTEGDCIQTAEIEDAAVSRAKIGVDATVVDVPDNFIIYGEQTAYEDVTISSVADEIPCNAHYRHTVVRVTLSGGSYTLTSNPQITAGIVGQTCEITVVAVTTPGSDVLTIADGNGAINAQGAPMSIALHGTLKYEYTVSGWRQKLGSGLDGLPMFYAAGVRTVGTGSGPFAVNSIAATGTIIGRVSVPTPITADTLSLAVGDMLGQVYVNADTGADGLAITLAGVESGLYFCVMAFKAETITVDPAAGDIMNNYDGIGGALAAGNKVSLANVAGNQLCFLGIDTTNWIIHGRVGTATDGGP